MDRCDLYQPGSQVTEPVDKVFGMFGLLPAYYRNAIDVDCLAEQREQYWKVYLEVAQFELTISGLDILPFARSEERPSMLPSWVPNWILLLPSPV